MTIALTTLDSFETPRSLPPFTEEGVFIKRALLHSLRNTESLVMGIMLPVMLMLLFTFVFGGALDAVGRLRELRGARHHPALRRVRGVGDGGRA